MTYRLLRKGNDVEVAENHYYGRNTDIKPLNKIENGIVIKTIVTGSTFYCVNSKEMYMFDEDGGENGGLGEWILQ